MSLSEFDEYTMRLKDTWWSRDENFGEFDEYEQETIALYLFNSDYGANGLPDYFAWQGFSSLDYTLRGLKRIGANRLATIVQEYADLLREHGFEPANDNVYDFINDCPADVQAQFDARQVEASHLCNDFYLRWEKYFDSRSQ